MRKRRSHAFLPHYTPSCRYVLSERKQRLLAKNGNYDWKDLLFYTSCIFAKCLQSNTNTTFEPGAQNKLSRLYASIIFLLVHCHALYRHPSPSRQEKEVNRGRHSHAQRSILRALNTEQESEISQ